MSQGGLLPPFKSSVKLTNPTVSGPLRWSHETYFFLSWSCSMAIKGWILPSLAPVYFGSAFHDRFCGELGISRGQDTHTALFSPAARSRKCYDFHETSICCVIRGRSACRLALHYRCHQESIYKANTHFLSPSFSRAHTHPACLAFWRQKKWLSRLNLFIFHFTGRSHSKYWSLSLSFFGILAAIIPFLSLLKFDGCWQK